MNRSTLVSVVVLLASGTCSDLTPAATFEVRNDGLGDFPTIADAVAAAAIGDTVLVEDGVFVHPTHTGGPIDFLGKNIVLKSRNGPLATRIDLNGGGGAFLYRSAEDTSSVFKGFTVYNGATATDDGVALQIKNSSPKVIDCVFTGNVSRNGGAVSCTGGEPVFDSSTFSGNSTQPGGRGGALLVESSARPVLRNCIIWSNCADAGGDQVYVAGASVTFLRCLLDDTGIEGPGAVNLDSATAFDDPIFCDPSDCSDAPTVAGDYTLHAASAGVPLEGTGRNAGGVLIWHHDPVIQYTGSGSDYCGSSTLLCPEDTDCPPFADEADCRASIQSAAPSVTQGDFGADEPFVLHVFAAFPEGSCPELAGASFGLSYNETNVVIDDFGPCADIETPTGNWPQSGEGVTLSWTSPVESQLVPIYWLAAFADSYADVLSMTPHPSDGGVLLDGSAIETPIAGYGTLGFNMPGHNPSPLSHSPADQEIGALPERCGEANHWTGDAGNSQWEDRGNWDRSRVPNEMDYVYLTPPGNVVFTGSGKTVTVKRVAMSGGFFLFAVNNNTLRVTKGLDIRFGQVFAGAIDLAGPLDWAYSGLMTENGRISTNPTGTNRIVLDGPATFFSVGVAATVVSADVRQIGPSVIVFVAGGLTSLEVPPSALRGTTQYMDSSHLHLAFPMSTNELHFEPGSHLMIRSGLIDGTGTLRVGGTLDFLDYPAELRIEVPFILDSSGTLTADRDCTVTEPIRQAGDMVLNDLLTIHRTWELGPDALLSLGQGSVASGVSSAEIRNFGHVLGAEGGPSSIEPALINEWSSPALHGQVEVQAGGTLTLRALNNQGRIQINENAVLAVQESLIVAETGRIDSNGSYATLAAPPVLVNDGAVSIGGSLETGILRIQGDFTQSPTGSLDFDIGGLIAGVEFDQLDVSGSTVLAGNINISLVNGYVPAIGDSIDLIVSGGSLLRTRRTGFNCRSGFDLPNGLFFEEVPLQNGLRLRAVPQNGGTNQPPAAADDFSATVWGAPIQIHVLTNDGDPDGDHLAIADVSFVPSGGVVAIDQGDTTLTYVPTFGYVGADTLGYVVTDCNGSHDDARVVIDVGCSGGFVHRVPSDFGTIQDAVDFACDGDTVLVASGIFTGPGNKNIDLLGKAICVTSTGGGRSTILDCEADGFGFITRSGESATTSIKGFTIRNAYQAGNDGGAIRVLNSSPVIQDCVLYGNRAMRGGAIYVENGVVEISGSTIVANYAEERGGAIYGDGSSSISVVYSVIWENCASDLGDQFWSSGAMSFDCSVVDTTGAASEQIDFVGPVFSEEPHFCGRTSCDTAPTSQGNYLVDVQSICLPGGNSCGILLGALPQGCNHDDPTSSVDFEIIGVGKFRMGSPFPNPAKSRASLSIDVPWSADLQLQLFDVQGRLLQVLADRRFERGRHHLSFNLESTSAFNGVYFIRLLSPQGTQHKKIVAVR